MANWLSTLWGTNSANNASSAYQRAPASSTNVPSATNVPSTTPVAPTVAAPAVSFKPSTMYSNPTPGSLVYTNPASDLYPTNLPPGVTIGDIQRINEDKTKDQTSSVEVAPIVEPATPAAAAPEVPSVKLDENIVQERLDWAPPDMKFKEAPKSPSPQVTPAPDTWSASVDQVVRTLSEQGRTMEAWQISSARDQIQNDEALISTKGEAAAAAANITPADIARRKQTLAMSVAGTQSSMLGDKESVSLDLGNVDALLETAKKQVASGTLWDSPGAAQLSGTDLAPFEDMVKSAEKYRTRANDLIRENKFAEASAALARAESIMDQYKSSRREFGKTVAKQGLFRKTYYDGTSDTDATQFLAWASVLSPLLTLGVTSAITISNNREQREFAEEENEKDRQQRLDEIRLRGDYELQAAGISAEASSKPAIAATSGSLGGNFHSA